jgi:glutamate synthase domain-containing protein 1
VELPPSGKYATGLFFLDQREAERTESQNKFEAAADELGMKVVCWRDVPHNNDTLGESALKSEPAIVQVSHIGQMTFFQRNLVLTTFVLRTFLVVTIVLKIFVGMTYRLMTIALMTYALITIAQMTFVEMTIIN